MRRRELLRKSKSDRLVDGEISSAHAVTRRKRSGRGGIGLPVRIGAIVGRTRVLRANDIITAYYREARTRATTIRDSGVFVFFVFFSNPRPQKRTRGAISSRRRSSWSSWSSWRALRLFKVSTEISKTNTVAHSTSIIFSTRESETIPARTLQVGRGWIKFTKRSDFSGYLHAKYIVAVRASAAHIPLGLLGFNVARGAPMQCSR